MLTRSVRPRAAVNPDAFAPRRFRLIQRALFVVAAVNAAVLVWDLITGGIYFKVLGVAFSSWDIRRPALYAAISGALALWLRDRSAAETSWDWIARRSRPIAALAAIATVALAFRFGVFVAGASDQYGYVSQAQLWTTGRLVVADRLTALSPLLGPAVAPLGYRLARTPGAIVPTYPPGLPLCMAAAQMTVGPSAVFWVVPLLAGVVVWLTYVLGERTVDRPAALLACLLCASSPIFLFLAFEPMTDVPATAWWLLAWVLAVVPGTATAAGAGLASAAAILTRPNLVVLALVVALVVGRSRPRLRRLLLFAAPVALADLFIAALYWTLYGSPLESGFGPPAYLFHAERIPQNLPRYFGWLIELHGAGILLAFAAPLVIRQSRSPGMLIFFAVLLSCYLPYFVYDNWTFLRFLMPAIPLLFILASGVAVRAIGWLPPSIRGLSLIAVCLSGCLWYGLKTDRLGVFGPVRAEDRYQIVGEYVARTLPPNAAVITMIQSGSVRWYGKRPTVRWDLIDDDRFDASIDILRARGYEPYVLLEDDETQEFRRRFEQTSLFGRIDWPPMIEYTGLPNVRVYAIADRARHLAGERTPKHLVAPPN
jgi:hypothetical protein